MRHHLAICFLVLAGAGLGAASAHAGPAARAVPMDDTGDVPRVHVHPDRVTAIYVPERIVHVVNSHPEDHRVGFHADRVLVRPLRAGAASGNLIIRTAGHVIGVVLEPARTSAEATSHLVFVPGRGARRAPEPLSLQLHGVFGRVQAGDPEVAEQTDQSLLAGAAAHLSYRGSAYHAYEATLTLAHGAIRLDDYMHEGFVGQMSRNLLLGRLQLGASLRYGQRLAPFVRGAAGLLGRALVGGRLRTYGEGVVIPGPADTILWDVALSAGAGIEVRLGDTWRAGISVTRTRVVTEGPRFASLEGAIHVAW